MEVVKAHFRNWWFLWFLGLVGLIVLAYNMGWLKFGKITFGKDK